MWTSSLFRGFVVVLGVEFAVFTGFLGWLLVGLRRKQSREAREEEFRERLVDMLEANVEMERWSELAAEFADDIVRTVLLEMIHDADPPDGVERLAEFYRREGLAELHLRNISSDTHTTRLEALRAMVGVARPEDLEQIRAAIGRSNVEHVLAGRIAVDVGTPDDVVDIFRGLHLESRLMEEPVYAVLESMQPGPLSEVFARWEEFESPAMKRVLLRVAADFELEGTLDRIRHAARSGHLELRTAACSAAARLDDVRTGEIVVGLLQDVEPAVRARAATALGEHDPEGAVEPLRRTMTDPDFWVRQNAASSLRRLGEPGMRALREVVEESDDAFAVDAAQQEISRHESTFHGEESRA